MFAEGNINGVTIARSGWYNSRENFPNITVDYPFALNKPGIGK